MDLNIQLSFSYLPVRDLFVAHYHYVAENSLSKIHQVSYLNFWIYVV